jgi:hypothetical protein
MSHIRKALFPALAVGVLAVVACQDGSTPTDLQQPALDLVDVSTTPDLEPEKNKVCKIGTDAYFEVSRTFVAPSSQAGQSATQTVFVADGTCKNVAEADFGNPMDVTITELVPTGYQLDKIEWLTRDGVQTFTGTNTIGFQIPTVGPTVTTFYNSMIPQDGGGCTPGYWRNHYEDWASTGYSPSDDFDTVFGVDYFSPDISLAEAIWLGGGGVRKLARHGTAALLNAAHPSVDYPLTVAEVIALVQAGELGDVVAYNELLVPGFCE